MKKILFLLLGLMSLVVLSSCDDKFIFDEDKSFLPIGYLPKTPAEDILNEVDTLQILGVRGLVFDELEKSDWRIISPPDVSIKGTEPLKLAQDKYAIGTGALLTEVITNYENIPIALGNTEVRYSYMGQEMKLEPLEDMMLVVNLKEEYTSESPYFVQYGNIEFVLRIGYYTLKRHSIRFMVIDPSIESIDLDEDETTTGE